MDPTGSILSEIRALSCSYLIKKYAQSVGSHTESEKIMGRSDKGLPTVACKYCGQPSKMLATKQCNNCWEVASRLRHMPLDVIESILASIRPEFLQYLRKQGYEHGVRDEHSRSQTAPGRGDMGG